MRSAPIRAAAVLLFSTLLVFVAGPAFAANPVTDFDYTLSGSTATITNYIGTGTDVEIPAVITVGGVNYTVTAIGHNAFRGNFTGAPLTSVVIPDTVGDNAFRGGLLVSVVIPDSVLTIGTYAFYNNLLATVALGNSVTTIGNNAFRGNYLTAMTIPASVTSICNNTFADNTTGLNTLTSVIFAGSAPMLGTAAFFTGPGPVFYFSAGSTGFSATWYGYAVREVSAAESGVTLTPTGPVLADGTTPATLSVTVGDDTHAPVAGVPVIFSVPAGITASAADCTTGSDGSCAVTLTSTMGGAYTVSAKVGSDPSLLSQTVAFTAPAGAAQPTKPVRPKLAGTGADLEGPLTLALLALTLGLALLGAVGVRRTINR